MATSPATLVADLVEELVSCLADAFHSLDVPYRQIRMGDVPAFGGDLVFGDPVLDFRAVNARPAFPARKEDVHFIGDLRHEVVDVDVPVAVVGSGEEQLFVLVQKHETHVVDSPHPVSVVKDAVPQLQQGAQPGDRKSTRLNSSHLVISYAVFCLKKKKKYPSIPTRQRRLILCI